jgi:transcriptional regulator with XRE-family HTH domain
MPTVVYIGDRLRELRKQQFLTQHMLAERSGVSQVAIARIERNRAEPHFSTIHKLADALGVSPEEFVKKEDGDA